MTAAAALKQAHQDSKNPLLVLPAFLSVPQCLSLEPPTPTHCFALLSLWQVPCFIFLCSVFCLPSPDSEFCFCFSVCWTIHHTLATLAKPLAFKFAFMFTPFTFPCFHAFMCYFHNIPKPSSPSVHVSCGCGTIKIHEIPNKINVNCLLKLQIGETFIAPQLGQYRMLPMC